ncbi:general substrate transporter [Rickenella mellea]|uniref:General substrate transporter n=1 Tax=Rickenella mellea TaxID=50990 RepID=A0A4Y7QIZ5_9AGAM|nr:general substrate transporter [Rickenella mellea]
MHQRDSNRFTLYGCCVCIWILISPFQYGFHISALNQLQSVITCRKTGGLVDFWLGIPTCVRMTDAQFSAVTASFTAGGLVGSLAGNVLQENYGRKGALRIHAALIALGAGMMTIAASITVLFLGRFIIGIAVGIGVCVAPVFIGEIAPATIKGSVGVLTQMSIVIGVLITQSLGIALASPFHWRFVTLFSFALALQQIIFSGLITESPAWLSANKLELEARKVAAGLWGTVPAFLPSKISLSTVATPFTRNVDVTDDPEDPLLEGGPDDHIPVTHIPALSVHQIIQAPELRNAVLIMTYVMIAQQFSVLYYSNDILAKTLPDLASFVSLGITLVNALMTFPPIFLIESLGRKSLLKISIGGSLLSLLLVGYGINAGLKILSSVAIMAFVASFACGLGPVPFVIISDVAPYHAVSALSSVALSINWVTNFIVGLVFLPLRNLLAGGEASREGRVFYVFAGLLAVFSLVFSRVYKG